MSFFPPEKNGGDLQAQEPPLGASLHIASQDSAGTEEITVRGLKQTLFVVIKNSPFVVRMCLTRPLEECEGFSDIPISAQLVYDEEEATREVAYIKTAPLQVKYVIGENNDHVDAECRIKALTSQHEDINFRIKFTALDPTTGEPREPHMSVLSAPIKVVSKPEQLKNPRKGASYSAALKSSRVSGMHLEQAKMLQATALSQLEMLRGIVQAREDRMRAAGRAEEILANVEDVLPEGYAPMKPAKVAGGKKKKRKRRGEKNYSDEEYGEEDEEDEAPKKRSKSKFADPFDAAFFQFYAAFSSLDPSQSATAVRGQSRRIANREALTSFCDVLQKNAFKIQTGGTGTAQEPDYCTCIDCPHRQKLAGMNNYLDE